MNEPDFINDFLQYQNVLTKVHFLIEIDRYEEAVRMLNELLLTHPEDAHILGLLAGIHIELNDEKAALSFADRAIAADPDSELGYSLRSQLLLKSDKEAALLSAYTAVEKSPDDLHTLYTLVNALIANDKLQEAQRVAERLHHLFPDKAFAYEVLAEVAFAREWWHDAARLSLKSLERDAGRAKPHFQLGAAFFNSGQFDKAAEAFLRCVQLNPTHRPAHRMTARSASAYLESATPRSSGPYGFSPLMLIFFLPFCWWFDYTLVIDALTNLAPWKYAITSIFFTLAGTVMWCYCIWNQHQYWLNLSASVRRVYLLVRWGWLRKICPEWFDRQFAIK